LKELAYRMVDEVFDSFVNNNKSLLEIMSKRRLYSFEYDTKKRRWYTVVTADGDRHFICGLDCLYDPWYIRHIIIIDYDLVFMNKDFDKLYHYDLRM
jgi:hypothetical protein